MQKPKKEFKGKKKNPTTMRYHLTLLKWFYQKDIWQGCEEKNLSTVFGGNVNWCSHYEK